MRPHPRCRAPVRPRTRLRSLPSAVRASIYSQEPRASDGIPTLRDKISVGALHCDSVSLCSGPAVSDGFSFVRFALGSRTEEGLPRSAWEILLPPPYPLGTCDPAKQSRNTLGTCIGIGGAVFRHISHVGISIHSFPCEEENWCLPVFGRTPTTYVEIRAAFIHRQVNARTVYTARQVTRSPSILGEFSSSQQTN